MKTGLLPLGVTGNTSDSGSEESWFEPRRGNFRNGNLLGFVGHSKEWPALLQKCAFCVRRSRKASRGDRLLRDELSIAWVRSGNGMNPDRYLDDEVSDDGAGAWV